MNKLSRRQLAGLALAAPLGACATLTGPTLSADAQIAAQDIALVSQGLVSALGIFAPQSPALTKALTTVQLDAKAIGDSIAASGAPAQSTLEELFTIVGAIATAILPGIPGAGQALVVVQAALALAPSIFAAFGFRAASPQFSPAFAASEGMSPDAARLVLRSKA